MQWYADEFLPDEHRHAQCRDIGQCDGPDHHNRGDQTAQQDQYHAEHEGECGHGAGNEVLAREGLDIQQRATRSADADGAARQGRALDSLQRRRDDFGTQLHGFLAEPLSFWGDDHPRDLAVA